MFDEEGNDGNEIGSSFDYASRFSLRSGFHTDTHTQTHTTDVG